VPFGMRSKLSRDFEQFGALLPRDWVAHVRDAYRIDLSGEYLGVAIPHPIGKASGQLSLRIDQLETDGAAGLAFVVLKTLIGQSAAGTRRMEAWAIHESRMAVERRNAADGREGWTVTWKGRGWDRSLEEYLSLLRAGRQLAASMGMLAIPSVKLHLPSTGEEFDIAEYNHTLQALREAWGEGELLVEKDFSPTLAGDTLAAEGERILRWVREVPGLMRTSSSGAVRVALKLMNARFDDDFQGEMLRAANEADAVTVFNRLWDPERGVAFGGWDLSDRNLRVLRTVPRSVPRSGTGNVCSGRLIAEYARAGCSSVQLHTFFQLPLSAYPAAAGSRTARALHSLVFDPRDGLLATMLDLEQAGVIGRVGGELRFLDLLP